MTRSGLPMIPEALPVEPHRAELAFAPEFAITDGSVVPPRPPRSLWEPALRRRSAMLDSGASAEIRAVEFVGVLRLP